MFGAVKTLLKPLASQHLNISNLRKFLAAMNINESKASFETVHCKNPANLFIIRKAILFSDGLSWGRF